MMNSLLQLYVFVEGDDDQRFFERLIKPKLLNKYLEVKTIKYAQKPPSWVNKFVSAISKNPTWATYFFLKDYDESTCISGRKTRIINKCNRLSISSIIVVVNEIESWYLSGINDSFLRRERIDTNISRIPSDATKEFFQKLVGDRDRILFMNKIIDNYSFKLARGKNKSFNYLLTKLNVCVVEE